MSQMSPQELSGWINTHKNIQERRQKKDLSISLIATVCPSFASAISRPKPSLSDPRFAIDMAHAGLHAMQDIAERDPLFTKFIGEMPRLMHGIVDAGIRESVKKLQEQPISDWRYLVLSFYDAKLLEALIDGFIKGWKKLLKKEAKPKIYRKKTALKSKKPAKKKQVMVKRK